VSTPALATASRTLASGLGFTEGPLWTRDGRLLVTSVSRGVVHEIDLAGGVVGTVETGGGPNGLAQDRRGRVWVAQNGARMMPSRSTLPTRPGLQWIDLADGVVHDAGTGAHLAPNDLVEGPDGRIWFTDPSHDGPGALWAHDPDTGTGELLAEEIEYPNGLVIDPDGTRLVLAETRTGRLLRYGWDGAALTADGVLATLPDGGADGLALGPDGDLYVAVPRADRIAVLEPDGRERTSLRFDGPTFPTNLCFAGPARDVLVVTAAKGGRVLALDLPTPPTRTPATRTPATPGPADRPATDHA
jgi:gluconolactonase